MLISLLLLLQPCHWFIPSGGFGDDQPVPPPLVTLFKIASKVTSLVGKALRYSEEEGGGMILSERGDKVKHSVMDILSDETGMQDISSNHTNTHTQTHKRLGPHPHP